MYGRICLMTMIHGQKTDSRRIDIAHLGIVRVSFSLFRNKRKKKKVAKIYLNYTKKSF